jgi:dTMP kinase
MNRGKFITIEGTEGAGKTTAKLFITNYLEKAGYKVVVTREPGGTDIAEEIRNVLLHRVNNEGMLAETELLLMFASRAQHIYNRIEPTLLSGEWVLSDRYVDASYAYQGGGRGLDIGFIKMLDKCIVQKLYPDLTFLLDVPAEMGIARAEQRGSQKDRIEQEKIDFFVRVRETYLERAQQDPKRIKVIDASMALPQVQSQMQRVLDTFLAKG